MTNSSTSESTTWNGIPRKKIKWHPIIDEGKCSQCLSCVNFCKQKVYKEKNGKPVVENPLKCVVGCIGCERICPAGAISHPPKEYLEQLTSKTNSITSCCSSGGCCPNKA